MANHIHVLLTPFARIRIVTRELKGIAALESLEMHLEPHWSILAGGKF